MEKQQDLPLTSPEKMPETVAATGFWQARRLGLAVAAAMAAVDLLSKWVILMKATALPVTVVPGLFTLTFAWNRGVSFSFLADADHTLRLFDIAIPASAWLPALWSTVAVVAICLFVWWLGKETLLLSQIGLGFIIGGALGNLLDRLMHGAVLDFLLFYWDNWYFPAFNLADTWITCGVGLLFLDALRQNEHSNKGNKKGDDA